MTAGRGRDDGTMAGAVASSHAVRLLGAAFLLQAIGSAVSGLVLAPVDLLLNSAPEDMAATMADIAANEGELRASIVGEMITAGGIVALGVMLFTVVRRHGHNIAAVALGLYVVEAALLAVREVMVFALWSTSEQAAIAPATSDTLTAQATAMYESQAFAYSLHTLDGREGRVDLRPWAAFLRCDKMIEERSRSTTWRPNAREPCGLPDDQHHRDHSRPSASGGW